MLSGDACILKGAISAYAEHDALLIKICVNRKGVEKAVQPTSQLLVGRT